MFSIKAINSLVHGGPYLAIHRGATRVAWYNFKSDKITKYNKVTDQEMSGIEEVVEWLADAVNYNKAAMVWNSFSNGVSVKLRS